MRERREAIPILAAHFLSRYAARYRRALSGLEPAALQAADLGLYAQTAAGSAHQTLDDLSLEAVEALLVRKALSRSNGNVSHAAEALGWSRGALYRRMEKYNL